MLHMSITQITVNPRTGESSGFCGWVSGVTLSPREREGPSAARWEGEGAAPWL